MSAFSSSLVNLDIGELLQNLNASSAQLTSLKTNNLLRQSTIGLKQIYTEIIAASNFPAKSSSQRQEHSDASGKLIIGRSIPLLGKRYQLQDLVGEGTFSQIFKAVDLSGTKPVAIKVMHVGFQLLGAREHALLRFLSSKALRWRKFFIRELESFCFDKHFCIVMELYNCTLINLLTMPKYDPLELKAKRFSDGSAVPQLEIHQPRVVRCIPSLAGIPVHRAPPQPEPPHRPFDMPRMQYVASSLVSALCVMRNEGIVHSDIKPENCFLKWTSSEPLEGSILALADLPHGFEIFLGDFGNSIHLSEASKEFSSYDIQSLPYRAPEVLLGVPFGFQIDVWSLGIVLVELCIGAPLFAVRSREELFLAHCDKLSTPPYARFAGGRYRDLYEIDRVDAGGASSVSLDYGIHIAKIKKLLEISTSSSIPSEFVHLIAGMLHPDPDMRLTANDALRHSFLSPCLQVPLCLLEQNTTHSGAAVVSLRALRSKKSNSVHASAAVPLLVPVSPRATQNEAKDLRAAAPDRNLHHMPQAPHTSPPTHTHTSPHAPSTISVLRSLPFPSRERDKEKPAVVPDPQPQTPVSPAPRHDSLLSLSTGKSGSGGKDAPNKPLITTSSYTSSIGSKMGRAALQGGGSLLAIPAPIHDPPVGAKRPRQGQGFYKDYSWDDE